MGADQADAVSCLKLAPRATIVHRQTVPALHRGQVVTPAEIVVRACPSALAATTKTALPSFMPVITPTAAI